MDLMLELEIDAACAEFMRQRGCDTPQPIVTYLDAPPEDEQAIA